MKQPSLVILLTLAASATAYTCQDYGNPDNAMGYDCSDASEPGVLQLCADCHCQTYNQCREASPTNRPTSPTPAPIPACSFCTAYSFGRDVTDLDHKQDYDGKCWSTNEAGGIASNGLEHCTACVDDDGWEDSATYTVSAGFIHSRASLLPARHSLARASRARRPGGRCGSRTKKDQPPSGCHRQPCMLFLSQERRRPLFETHTLLSGHSPPLTHTHTHPHSS